MLPLRKTIVGFDFSKGAKYAMAHACPWVEACGGELVIAHVTPGPAGMLVPLGEAGPVFIDTSEMDAEAKDRLDRVTSGFADRKFKTRGELLFGAPGSALLEFADREKAGLVVVGADESGLKSALLGSVAETVAREALEPVLIARGARPEVESGIVVGVDLSPHSRAALTAAAEIGAAFKAKVTAVHITPPLIESRSKRDDADKRRREVREHADSILREWTGKLGVDYEIVEGDPATELLAAAKRRGAGLLVLSRRGLSMLQRLLLGSVVTKVIRRAPISVLVVPRVREGKK